MPENTVRFESSARVRAHMPCSRMMPPMRFLDAVAPFLSRVALIFLAPWRSRAVAPDRAYVAGDRIHMLCLGMPGHPVVGGVGNVRYPALR